MKKTTISKDILIVSLIICVFVAIGGAVNGEAIATLFLAAFACFGLGVIYNRKKHDKKRKCVELSHKIDTKRVA